MKVLISKEDFIKAIDVVKSQFEYFGDIYNCGINFDDDSPFYRIVNDYVELLGKFFFRDVSSAIDMINWFICDKDFGRNKSLGGVYVNKDGNYDEISMNDAADLYDFLVDYYIYNKES